MSYSEHASYSLPLELIINNSELLIINSKPPLPLKDPLQNIENQALAKGFIFERKGAGKELLIIKLQKRSCLYRKKSLYSLPPATPHHTTL
ncbi:MAG: hypothetical protein QW067_12455 [Thermofilaceae archaeon]